MRRCLARSGAACCLVQFDGRRGAVLFYRQSDGPEVVEKLTGKTVLDSMDGFFTATANTPFWYVGYCLLSLSIHQLCCRFDFNTFSLVFYRHRLGQLPATIVYSWAGSMLTGGLSGLSPDCLFCLP